MNIFVAKSLLSLCCGVLSAGLLTQRASAITIDFSSIGGASVEFLNGNFYFNNNAANGYSLNVTLSNGNGDSIGNLGAISGVFSIGAVSISGTTESAPVTGSGVMSIFDGSATLTGTVVWNMISTTGTGSTLNVNGVLNLTSITYAGGGSDLGALAAAGSAYEVITLQFVPAKTLTTLANATSPLTTSFSGSITTAVPDGGMTIALLGLALLGVGGLHRKLTN